MGKGFSSRQLDHIVGLAKLSLTAQEKKRYFKQLKDILAYIEQLGQVKTQDSQSISQITGLKNVWRQDKITQSLASKEVLKNSSKTQGNYLAVDQILEER